MLPFQQELSLPAFSWVTSLLFRYLDGCLLLLLWSTALSVEAITAFEQTKQCICSVRRSFKGCNSLKTIVYIYEYQVLNSKPSGSYLSHLICFHAESHILIAICLVSFQASPRHLQPFIPDKNVPSELEYMVISFKEPTLYLRQWSSDSVCQEIRFSSQVDCRLLECRNVTMQTVVQPFGVSGQIALSDDGVQRRLDGTMIMDSVLVNFGQHVVHSLNTAIQAWQQVCTFHSSVQFSHVWCIITLSMLLVREWSIWWAPLYAGLLCLGKVMWSFSIENFGGCGFTHIRDVAHLFLTSIPHLGGK